MDQQHQDYEERGVSPFWLPPIWLVIVLFILFAAGGLFLITLLVAYGLFKP